MTVDGEVNRICLVQANLPSVAGTDACNLVFMGSGYA